MGIVGVVYAELLYRIGPRRMRISDERWQEIRDEWAFRRRFNIAQAIVMGVTVALLAAATGAWWLLAMLSALGLVVWVGVLVFAPLLVRRRRTT